MKLNSMGTMILSVILIIFYCCTLAKTEDCAKFCARTNIIGIDCYDFCSKEMYCGAADAQTEYEYVEENQEPDQYLVSYCLVKELLSVLERVVNPAICCNKCQPQIAWGYSYCAANCIICPRDWE